MASPDKTEEADAAGQIRDMPAPQVSPPAESDVAAGLAARQAAGPSGITDVDAAQILATIQALQQRIDSLEEEKAAGNGVPVVATAETARDLIATHAAQHPGGDFTDLTRLADDAVDAAKNAADSGDGTELGKIREKLARALRKAHPGPGDHHYFTQALGFVEDHLADAIDGLTPKKQSAAKAELGSSQPPAKVVQGSVTG